MLKNKIKKNFILALYDEKEIEYNNHYINDYFLSGDYYYSRLLD